MTDEWTACNCVDCQRGCWTNPGWMTVEEARAAIESGLGDRLMLDWWENGLNNLLLLCPASQGYEADWAPAIPEAFIFAIYPWSKGACTFYKGSRCEIHDSGFKPWECRHAHHSIDHYKDRRHLDFNKLLDGWLTPEGLALVAKWREVHNICRMGFEDSD